MKRKISIPLLSIKRTCQQTWLRRTKKTIERQEQFEHFGYQEPTLITEEYLRENLHFSDSTAYDQYKAFFELINRYTYTRAFTFTFTKPITDLATLTEVIRNLKQRVNRQFYKKNLRLKFVFVIEEDAVRYKGLPKFHIHVLVSALIEPDKDIHKIKRRFFPEPQKLPKRNSRKKRKPLGVLGPFETAIYHHATSLEIDHPQFPKIGKVHCERIYSQEGIVDYLLKSLKKSSNSLNIDYINSDLEQMSCLMCPHTLTPETLQCEGPRYKLSEFRLRSVAHNK